MKILKDSITLLFFQEDNEIECRMDGKVEYEDEFGDSRSHTIPMTEQEKKAIRNFAINTAIPSFKSQEGIS